MIIGTIAYSCALKRPGCVLMQAALGATIDVGKYFDADSWIIGCYPPDMVVRPVTADQLQKLVAITNAAKPSTGWLRI